MTEQQRPRTQVTDATGKNVAANVRRVREGRGLSTYALSGLLRQAGRPISPSALAKIERAERRVDVGDLMALAVALNIAPSGLLLPVDTDPLDEVEITGSKPVHAIEAWEWIDGRGPLGQPVSGGAYALYEAVMTYRLFGRPHWLVDMENEEDEGRVPRTSASRIMRAAGIEATTENGKTRYRLKRQEDDADG
ncbi:helix-turn-helix transcriptional regulator [Streptomyces glaucosporus]